MSQIKKNLFFNVISLLINIGIGFFYTPYLVRSLGIIAYGIIPLAMILSQYITILTTSLTGTLTRFYAVEIQNLDFVTASKYLSSSLFVILLIIGITIPIFSIIIINIESIFNIPQHFLKSTRILFFFTFLSFYLSLFSSYFNITLYANNRLDLLNVLNVFRNSTKIIFNILFFEFLSKDIKYIGYGNLVSEIIVFLLSFYFFLIYTNKEVKLKLKYFEKTSLLVIGSMTLWVIIHQLGDLAIYKINVYFVNSYWSTKESGALGAITDFGSYIMIVIGVVSTLFGPLILIAFSKKNHEEVKEMVINNSLIIGLLTTILASLFICFSKQFLNLWLGNGFEKYSYWFVLKLIDLPFFAAAGVFAFVYRSWNKVKLPALMTVVIGFVNIVITNHICNMSNGDIVYIDYILIFSAVCSFIQAYFLGIYMFKKIYIDINFKELLFNFPFKFILIFLFILVLSKIILFNFRIDKWFELLLCFSLIGVISLIFVYHFLISNNLKKYMILLFNKN
jgi:O-antigen/teichoic acid export membrane protein